LKASTVRVTHKPDRNWTPKAYKEREIPIHDTLANSLREWKKNSDKGCKLVFPTSGCNPKLNFLDELKAVAERVELNKDGFWPRFKAANIHRNKRKHYSPDPHSCAHAGHWILSIWIRRACKYRHPQQSEN
jgi:hypothetical protein